MKDKLFWQGFRIFLVLAFAFIFLTLLLLNASAAEIPHFKTHEFACRHCGQVKVDPELLIKLETLRHLLGDRVVVITSGYRCPLHNKEVGGVKFSQHLLGRAADVKVTGRTPAEVAQAARKLGFGFVKTYARFTHVDVRRRLP